MVFQSPILRAQYPTYKSPYGPNAVKSGAFGGVALFAVIFYASGIPRVQQDILQKIPFIGGHFIKEIPASDNVRNNLPMIIATGT
ncbi:ubiquinol-cytochrome-c reductase complex subunit-domain-containing protein [Xylaria cf. heliscus]|nr:ubiquinol-cytochrome-c reductase complex subunit-domain-containing protein [Xylaria cf. heliscus]